MSKKSINQKIKELDSSVEWFYGEEFSLEKASEKYKKAVELAREIEEDLKSLKNKIEVVDKDFSRE